MTPPFFSAFKFDIKSDKAAFINFSTKIKIKKRSLNIKRLQDNVCTSEDKSSFLTKHVCQ